MLSENHAFQIYDGEGKEVSTVVAAEDNMLKRIDSYYDCCYLNKGMFSISGKELEERGSLIKQPGEESVEQVVL